MKRLYISIALLLALFSAAAGDDQDDEECVYTLYVKTGTIFKAGTDSNISLTLGDAEGSFVYVQNLRSWGIMGHNHDYYERGNLDIFSGRGPCIGTPVCHLNLTSDGSGSHHGWYCEYVEVTSTGPHKQCSQTRFNVEQWLAQDRSPCQLSTELDGCGSLCLWDEKVKQGTKGKFVVGHRIGSSAA